MACEHGGARAMSGVAEELPQFLALRNEPRRVGRRPGEHDRHLDRGETRKRRSRIVVASIYAEIGALAVAGVVLVSGIYRPGADANDGERAYLGSDASKYEAQSPLPGLTAVEVPIVLAWSTADPPRLVTQGEKLNEFLCGAGHCPRTTVLTSRDSPSSVFDAGGTEGLADKTRQLISQVQARGLP